MSPTNELIDSSTAILIVDHGSRRAESNAMLEEVARRFAESMPGTIVEPAHMELAQPSIATAFACCVNRGASRVVVFPYFLSPGRHWTEDIPALTRAAAADHPGVGWLVTPPFGLHPGMLAIMADRIQTCLAAAVNSNGECEFCSSVNPCQFRAVKHS